MGAITSIFYMDGYKDKAVIGMILDSPLSNLEELVSNYVK